MCSKRRRQCRTMRENIRSRINRNDQRRRRPIFLFPSVALFLFSYSLFNVISIFPTTSCSSSSSTVVNSSSSSGSTVIAVMCVPEGNVVSGGGDCINGRSQFQPTAENRRNLFLFFLFLFDSPVCVCRRDCLMALFNLFFARSFSLVVGVVHTHTHDVNAYKYLSG